MIGGFVEPFKFSNEDRTQLARELQASECRIDTAAFVDDVEAAAESWIMRVRVEKPSARQRAAALRKIHQAASSLLRDIHQIRVDDEAERLMWSALRDIGMPHRRPGPVLLTAHEGLRELRDMAGAAAELAASAPGRPGTRQAIVALIERIADAFKAHDGICTSTEGGAFEAAVEILAPPILSAAGFSQRQTFHALIVDALAAN